jgi:hypothetical protein
MGIYDAEGTLAAIQADMKEMVNATQAIQEALYATNPPESGEVALAPQSAADELSTALQVHDAEAMLANIQANMQEMANATQVIQEALYKTNRSMYEPELSEDEEWDSFDTTAGSLNQERPPGNGTG